MTEEETKSVIYGSDYVWPNSLYQEMRDMAAISFLVYQFGYIVDEARKAKKNGETFVGLDVDDSEKLSKSEVTDSELFRSFTPAEIKKILEDNAEILSRKSDFRGESLEGIFSAIDKMQERADQCEDISRPITLEEFDDKFQMKECVYAVTRDSVNKRITVVFRGSDELAFVSNWIANASISKTSAILPEALNGTLDSLAFHTGFYNYIFNETVDETDPTSTTKYDTILSDVKSLVAKYPDYKVYTTGHSLGGALSTIAAFYLACEPDLPKPVSCINFASPRVGGGEFLEGVRHLEKTKQLRMLRSVNENDNVTTIPSLGYEHAGVQVTQYAKGWFGGIYEPSIDYKNPNDGVWTRFTRSWTNGILTNLNLGYDHSSYISRIELAKDHLEKTSLNELYADEKFTGLKFEDA